jgi:L-serine/L-threonine ammonia-lyase
MDIRPVKTPLIELEAFSALCGRRVMGKMESQQRTRSFKYRGILNLGKHLRDEGKTQLLSSSGGNAGLAAAVVGRLSGRSLCVVCRD